MADKELKAVPEEKEDYFELRIPKVSKGRVPVILTVILMILSYLAGLLTMRFMYENKTSSVITDATGAFSSYAKQLKLDTKQFTSCMESKKYATQVTTDTNNGSSLGVTGTPSFFINGRFLVGALDYSVFRQIIDQEYSGNRVPLPEEEVSSDSAKVDVALGHLPILGKDDAKVTIVEFSDFQCPFCERFFIDTFGNLKKDYIDTGKAKLAFRHYPLTSIHPNAETAHLAAECANEQGKFWEYHDLLFKMQKNWSDLPLVSQPAS